MISKFYDIDNVTKKIIPIIGIFDEPKTFIESANMCDVKNSSSIAKYSMYFADKIKDKEKFGLSVDEIAAINLFTLESDFYKILNKTLREMDRENLKPFFPYMRLLLLGLNKLPSFDGNLWRGVKLDLKDSYPKGKKFFWWAFSSCTTVLNVLAKDNFCGQTGVRTLFCITSKNGRDISNFSSFPEEREVILKPGYFIVNGVMECGNGLTIIDIEELTPPFDIFIGISELSPNPTSKPDIDLYPNPTPKPYTNLQPNSTPILDLTHQNNKRDLELHCKTCNIIEPFSQLCFGFFGAGKSTFFEFERNIESYYTRNFFTKFIEEENINEIEEIRELEKLKSNIIIKKGWKFMSFNKLSQEAVECENCKLENTKNNLLSIKKRYNREEGVNEKALGSNIEQNNRNKVDSIWSEEEEEKVLGSNIEQNNRNKVDTTWSEEEEEKVLGSNIEQNNQNDRNKVDSTWSEEEDENENDVKEQILSEITGEKFSHQIIT